MEVFEKMNKVDILIVDKIGIIIEGKLIVEIVGVFNDVLSEKEVL